MPTEPVTWSPDGHQPAEGTARPRRTMFGLPVIGCDRDSGPHDWHSDGVTFCPGAGARKRPCAAAELRPDACPAGYDGHGGHTWHQGDGQTIYWCDGYRHATGVSWAGSTWEPGARDSDVAASVYYGRA